jgi:hypothetical protein
VILLDLSAMSTETVGRPDTKIAVLLLEDLAAWQKLNMTAFLVSGVAHTAAESIGEAYCDADGTKYLPMFGQPVLVFAATSDELTRSLGRALARDVVPAVFTEELFATGNDVDNRAAVAAVARNELRLIGLALRADRGDVDKITKGLRLHG